MHCHCLPLIRCPLVANKIAGLSIDLTEKWSMSLLNYAARVLLYGRYCSIDNIGHRQCDQI